MGGPHNEHNYQISKTNIWVTQANGTSCCNFNHHLTDSILSKKNNAIEGAFEEHFNT